MAQRIDFTTHDDVVIVGNWVTAPTTVGAVILLHMYPSTKESFDHLQTVLAQRGLASLAIDLRGHGGSTTMTDGSRIDYRKFGPDETRSSLNDAIGAYRWIRDRGIDAGRIGVLGASFGANIALQLLVEEPQIRCAVALSPGLDYHGINALEKIDFIASHQAVWFIASRTDDDESVRAVHAMNEVLSVDVSKVDILTEAGHGTKMLEGDEELMGQIANWMRDRIQVIS